MSADESLVCSEQPQPPPLEQPLQLLAGAVAAGGFVAESRVGASVILWLQLPLPPPSLQLPPVMPLLTPALVPPAAETKTRAGWSGNRWPGP